MNDMDQIVSNITITPEEVRIFFFSIPVDERPIFGAELEIAQLVVEPQEAEEHKSRYGEHRVLALPFSNLGKGSIPARNWVWEHSIKAGAKRHWILDDNIKMIRRLHHQKRIRCNANNALRAATCSSGVPSIFTGPRVDLVPV